MHLMIFSYCFYTTWENVQKKKKGRRERKKGRMSHFFLKAGCTFELYGLPDSQPITNARQRCCCCSYGYLLDVYCSGVCRILGTSQGRWSVHLTVLWACAIKCVSLSSIQIRNAVPGVNLHICIRYLLYFTCKGKCMCKWCTEEKACT